MKLVLVPSLLLLDVILVFPCSTVVLGEHCGDDSAADYYFIPTLFNFSAAFFSERIILGDVSKKDSPGSSSSSTRRKHQTPTNDQPLRRKSSPPAIVLCSENYMQYVCTYCRYLFRFFGVGQFVSLMCCSFWGSDGEQLLNHSQSSLP